MSTLVDHIAPAFGLGFALGAAPGPVQVLILSQTARLGLPGGLRVMLGANGTLLVVMVVLALGLSSAQPGEAALRWLRLAGGSFLIVLAAQELRSLRVSRESAAPRRGRSLGPTSLGVASVVLNPGAWIFFATTASAVIANATADGGFDAALLAGVAMALGVSISDLSFALLGTGGKRLVGDRGLVRIRVALSTALGAIGIVFIVRGLVSR